MLSAILLLSVVTLIYSLLKLLEQLLVNRSISYNFFFRNFFASLSLSNNNSHNLDFFVCTLIVTVALILPWGNFMFLLFSIWIWIIVYRFNIIHRNKYYYTFIEILRVRTLSCVQAVVTSIVTIIDELPRTQRILESILSFDNSDAAYTKRLEQLRLKAMSTPLSRLQRLPLVYAYKIEPHSLYLHFIQHTLVTYNFFKSTLVALLLMTIYFIYTIFFFKIQFLKQLAVWFIIGMLYFWLMSGFNFFLKRYQFGKFTSQIQRFWKRTNTYFWLIEGFLILLFFYYYLNSSQEPVYMYDYSALNQEYLVSLHVIGTNVILLSVVIYFMYFVLLRINSNSWTQLNLYLLIISIFIFFSFFIETYQFYYIISTFNERIWAFNEEENLWSIEIDNPILRNKQQYLLVCLIAKYWHFLFIFLSWVFFLIKSFERRKLTYVLFGANLQNMIILYVLNLACYFQWVKWLFRRFLDLPYTWFMTNVDNKLVFRFFLEIKLLLCNFLSLNITPIYYSSIIHKSLNIWNVDSLCIWKFI